MRELEEREAEARRRILELEKEGADLDAETAHARPRICRQSPPSSRAARESLAATSPRAVEVDGKPLTGDYNADMDELLAKLDIERKRTNFLETQNRTLIGQLEHSDKALRRSRRRRRRIARRGWRGRTMPAAGRAGSAHRRRRRIADAESRVHLVPRRNHRGPSRKARQQARACCWPKSSAVEEELEKLREKVAHASKTTVMADWDSDRIEHSHMRERLNDIASEVSRLVYALEGNDPGRQ